MCQTKILKSYAQSFVLAILIALLLCNCRSASQHSSMRVSQQKDSATIRLSSKAHGSIASQTHTQTDINGNKWKVTWHFDTSKPADSVTGLSPASRLEIEGSEIRKQVKEQEHVSVETSDTLSYHQTETASSDEYTQDDSQKKKETGTNIERSIATGIIILTIIIAFVIYVRSNPPKQDK